MRQWLGSTLSRLEHAPEEGAAFAPPRYHKISHDARAIEDLFVTLFLKARRRPPRRIILDLDAPGYLPLYIFCGRDLLAAKLRRSNIDAAAQ